MSGVAQRRGIIAAAIVVLAGGIGGGLGLRARLARRDPARELFQVVLPAWQTARFRPGAAAGADGPESRQLLAAARAWPGVQAALAELDRAWPDDAAVRAAARAANAALRAAGLRYFLDVQPVGARPIVLTYDLAARVPWRIGARSVEVLRVRRLDSINVELALLGETNRGLPVVLLDRVEASVAEDLPAAFGRDGGGDRTIGRYNDFDRVALARLREQWLARGGQALAGAVTQLRRRNDLLETMRARFHGGAVQLAEPDGFVLGEPWLTGLRPYTRFDRPGGPLILDTDLREVVRADETLRAGPPAQALESVADLEAVSTEAHEARHALDRADRVGPPPPALFEAMPNSESSFIGMADAELRAYLGELHDAAAPACLSLAKLLRLVYGRGARRNPHFYAAWTILGQLDPVRDKEGETYLRELCALPDAELRARVAAAWQKLYDEPLPAGVRGAPAS